MVLDYAVIVGADCGIVVEIAVAVVIAIVAIVDGGGRCGDRGCCGDCWKGGYVG